MFLGGIAFIPVPAVGRVFLMYPVHVVVTISLGKDGCCGYREILAVALYYSGVGQVPVFFETVSVDKEMLRAHGESVDGSVHSEDGGVEDVDLVYFNG